jgi:hypothetical protein
MIIRQALHDTSSMHSLIPFPFNRFFAVALLSVLAAGCSSVKTKNEPAAADTAKAPAIATSPKQDDNCASNRRGCIYKGSYEPGERSYAVEEAKRLNLAELERLRRSFGQ